MKAMPLSAQDALWLTMDRPENLMVIDGAMVLGGVADFDALLAILDDTVARFPVLASRPLRRGTEWVWEPVGGLDPRAIAAQVSLGDGAGISELQEFVAQQRAVPLEHDLPLWRVFLVSPLVLDDGTLGSAVVSRFHHAIADGVRLTQLMLGFCDLGTGGTVPAVARAGTSGAPWSAVEAATGAVTETVSVVSGVAGAAAGATAGVVDATVGLARNPLRVPGALAGMVRSGVHGALDAVDSVRHPDRMLDALEVLGVDDHRSLNDVVSVTKLALTGSGSASWSGRPGPVKAVAWSKPIRLERVKAIGAARGATVNDVLLAAVAGGMRSYLAAREESLSEVVWMVPVNLKPFEENLPAELGNYFALVMLPMPLHHDDALACLDEVHHRMQRIKNSDEPVLTFGMQRVVSAAPDRIATALTDFFADKAVGVLTNVPGPTAPMTLAGVPVRQVVGFAPCSGEQSMTATIFSYAGEVTVGFATDATLVPDPAELATRVVREISHLDSLSST